MKYQVVFSQGPRLVVEYETDNLDDAWKVWLRLTQKAYRAGEHDFCYVIHPVKE